MKLNENGATRFESLYFCEKQDLRDIEFEPDDFQEAIVLSVEEAKEVLRYMENYYFHIDLRDAIKERIKQVEKSYEVK